MNAPRACVIIPTYNPHRGRLERTLAALQAQTLPRSEWELCIVDNHSPANNRVPASDASWHPSGRVIFETSRGSAHARRAGFAATSAALIVCVDDDNVLAPDYLEQALTIAAAHPSFGAYGGITEPEWEATPPAWTHEFHRFLAIRDYGPQILHARGERFGPEYTPNGAGMVVRRAVAETWSATLDNSPERASLGRAGRALGAHEDLDLAWAAFPLGLEVAYVPTLRLRHLIPPQRLTREYLGRLMHGMAYSGQFFEAARRGKPPAPPVPMHWLRKLRRYLQTGAAFNPSAWVWWRHYCGVLDARWDWYHSDRRDASPPRA